MEISLDALLGAQRDLADRLAQGVSGLLLHVQPPHKLIPFAFAFDIELPPVPFVRDDLPAAAVASLAEIGDRLGQAGSGLGGAVQHLSRQLPLPFLADVSRRRRREVYPTPPAAGDGRLAAEGGLALERAEERDPLEVAAAAAAAATGSAAAASRSGTGGAEESDEEDDELGFEIGTLGRFKRHKGRVNVSATYNTRHQTVDGSVVARGEIWRFEASRGGSTYGNNSGPPFLIQLGPIIFVRDSTFLFPINLSEQHLVWYGYDRKNGVHSICPAIWSKHKKWLLMSMMCLNPVSCSFMDVQFPNGQLTYVAGEGITASGFLPLVGGLLQVHGKCPGETKLSFSFKSTQGTRFTPAFQWPDNSLSFEFSQAVAWKKYGLMVKPSVQVSVCPTFGGSDPGIKAEIVHSLKEELSVMYGLSCSRHPSAFTSLSLGRSKTNGEVRSSGVVITMEAPLDNMGRPSLSVQLNGGFEF
ncbi:uncharacterized protein [Lolium perenne]|uniref:uncharacterized protein n=1 Tax=Lolium perenne TaxID=4522 RepID=UPI0021F58CF8|nr:uncharacterized protein LOC127326102 [Lolium perenne]